MHPPNATRIFELLRPESRVLDVGGWYRPFTRADVVVDLLPYVTRGLGGHCGEGPERFTESTWIVQDICRSPLPFPDKSFDFAICSHTLEDVRDPIFVCAELIRVARSGYIEVPSRVMESTRGLEGRRYVGYYHHRWLVDIEGQGIRFRFKPHAIHEDRRYYLPRRVLRRMEPADKISWMFWEDSFAYSEPIQVSHIKTREELAAFVDRTAPLNTLERLLAVLRCPLVARHYRDWSTVRHPFAAQVGADTPEGRRFWSALPEIDSR